MLTAQDDFIGHQTPTTFDHVITSDPAWTERLWWTGQLIPSGEAIFDLGLGYYPNKNVMDGFAGITVGTTQYNVRMSRRLRSDPLATRVGPLEIKVLEGLRRHRLSLEDNGSGLSFDIEFQASMEPHEEEHHFRRRQGKVVEDLSRAQQFGRYSGWIKAGGQEFKLTPQTWWGQRDHSWGIRSLILADPDNPPMSVWPPLFYSWTSAQFADYGYQWYINEKAPGKYYYLTGEQSAPAGKSFNQPRPITAIKHKIEWANDPLGLTLAAGEFEIEVKGLGRRVIQCRGLPGRYYLKSGMYGGYKGWAHGDDKGPLHVEHDVWDLRDSETRRVARTLSDHVIEYRDGDNVGYGIMEYGIAKGYPGYERFQDHPPF